MKNKLSIGLVFIALLAAYYFLGTDYLRQERLYDDLDSRIAEVGRTLEETPVPPVDLDSRLAEAQTDLDAVSAAFPGDLNSTRFINDVLGLAKETGVKAVPMIIRPWSLEKRADLEYHVLHLRVTASGSFSRFRAFTAGLESGDFPTLVVEKMTLDNEYEAAGGPEATVRGSLDLALYARSPYTD